VKVAADNGWVAARPSGTEDIYKIYAESFRSEAHLREIRQEARGTLARVFRQAAPDQGSP
jgi:phosphoglucomutase